MVGTVDSEHVGGAAEIQAVLTSAMMSGALWSSPRNGETVASADQMRAFMRLRAELPEVPELATLSGNTIRILAAEA